MQIRYTLTRFRYSKIKELYSLFSQHSPEEDQAVESKLMLLAYLFESRFVLEKIKA